MDLGLKGKKAIVTGGTRGIGRAIADLLVEEGCDVAVCARTGAGVSEAVAAFQARGAKAAGEAFDVADADAVAVRRPHGCALGGLDIFVANISGAMAGGNHPASWRKAVDVDILPPCGGGGRRSPSREVGRGAIVVIGTVSAIEVSGARRPYRGQGRPHSVREEPRPRPRAKNVRADLVRRARSTSRVGCGTWWRRTCPRCSRPRSAATPWAAWESRRSRRRGSVPGQPAGQFRHWRQPHLRRRNHPEGRLLRGQRPPCARAAASPSPSPPHWRRRR